MAIYFTSLVNAMHFWHEKHHKNIQWVLVKSRTQNLGKDKREELELLRKLDLNKA
jgi:hypothetical protein